MYVNSRDEAARSNVAGDLTVLGVRLAIVVTFTLAITIITSISFGAGSALADTSAQSKGSLWLFAVGVSQYRNRMIDLQFADNDARTLAATIARRSAGVFQKVNTRVLVNDQVTRQSIIDGITSFFAQAQPEDTGMIALMGHGVSANGVFYFVPYPADLSNLTTAGLPVNEFEQAVQKVSGRMARMILVVDTCHAAELNFNVRGLDQLINREHKARGISLVGQIAPKMPEAYIMSASESDENSWEDANYRLPDEKEGHGAFTYALLRGLDGAAAREGRVNILDLFSYASDEVPRITGGKQHPYVHGQGTNFEIATVNSASPEEQQQAAALTGGALKLRQKGDLSAAATTLARASDANPRDQVSRVLHDEVAADIAYKNSPIEREDVIEETAALLKKSKNAVPADRWSPRPLVLAFLDFKTLGGAPELAGLHEAMLARLSQSLRGTKRVSVVDRRLLDSVLRELRLSASDLSDPDTRLKIGRILVARLIGTGNIVFVGKDKYIVNLEMIDTETTEIKVNVSEPGTGADHILQVADRLEADVMKQLRRDYPLRGKIVALDGDQVVLDLGSKDGATVGTRMNAVIEEPIRVNGEIIARRLNSIGSIEITDVQEKASFAKVISRKTTLPAGTRVIQTSSKSVKAADSATVSRSAG